MDLKIEIILFRFEVHIADASFYGDHFNLHVVDLVQEIDEVVCNLTCSDEEEDQFVHVNILIVNRKAKKHITVRWYKDKQ